MRLLLLILLLVLPLQSVGAQNIPVFQSGGATTGHLAMFGTNGVIADAGQSPGGPPGVNPNNLNITGPNDPFCLNDAPITSTGGYHQICLGFGATPSNQFEFVLNSIAGAPQLPCVFIVNGTTLPCVGTPTGANTVANTAALRLKSIAGFTGVVIRVAPYPSTSYVPAAVGACAVDDGGACVAAAGGGFWQAQFSGPAYVGVWGAIDIGVGNATGTDSATAVANALAWCGAAPGRSVTLGGGRFVSSTSQTVSQYCQLTAAAPPNSENSSNTSQSILQQPGAILLGTGATLNNEGTITNVSVFPQGLTPPTSYADYWNKLQAFTGSGFTVPGTSLQSYNDVRFFNVFAVGFANCLNVAYAPRITIHNADVDCTNGIALDNIHDVGSITHIRGWEWFGGQSFQSATANISGVADNGSGAIRLTVDSTANFVTGQTLIVLGVGGALGVNGVWTVTVVDATHLDLQGSTFAGPSVSATLSTAAYDVTVPSVAGIWQGQTVTGTGIPGGTTVLTVDPWQKAVWLTNAPTSSGSQTLTFVNGAYTSGGTATLYNINRSGNFIGVTNSQQINYSDLFEFGWHIGYSLGSGNEWQMLNQAGCDVFPQARQNACVVVSGGNDNDWNGGNVTQGVVALVTTTSDISTLVNGVSWEMGGVGDANLAASLAAANDYVVIHAVAKRPTGETTYLADYHAPSTTLGRVDIDPTLNQWVQLTNAAQGKTQGGKIPQYPLSEQNWTPTLTFAGGNGSLAYTAQTGDVWIDLQGLATIKYAITLSSITGASGNAYLNLPVPCINTRQNWGDGAATMFGMASTVSSVQIGYGQTAEENFHDVVPIYTPSAGTSRQVTVSDFGASATINGSMRCRVR